MALSFGVAFLVTYSDDSLLAGMPLDEQMEAVEGMIRSTVVSTKHRAISRIDVHPDPEVVFPEPEAVSCDCSDGGAGYLVDFTYDATSPPDECFTIQACGECGQLEGDLEAAQAWIRRHDQGRAYCILGHVFNGQLMFAAHSDVWIDPSAVRADDDAATWLTLPEAHHRGIYTPANTVCVICGHEIWYGEAFGEPYTGEWSSAVTGGRCDGPAGTTFTGSVHHIPKEV